MTKWATKWNRETF